MRFYQKTNRYQKIKGYFTEAAQKNKSTLRGKCILVILPDQTK